METFWLEKAFKIIDSNHQPNHVPENLISAAVQPLQGAHIY